jgi:LuxR family maltose regulon positive regulatory protein
MAKKNGQQLTENQLKALESTHVLATKLYVPPARANTIARPTLVEKLLSGVEHPGSFILVSGPAGFGKTTLLSEFVARCQQPTAWVSLDEGDNDPTRFCTYLITACQSILEDIGDSALELSASAQQLPDDTIPTLLINELAAQDRSIALVLDDYHEIQNPSIHAGMLFLLEHLPHNLHIIVSTRIDPPWPLVRYRARNQLIEIRAQDLRFSVEEAAEFLNHTMGLDLPTEDVAALEARTEGWIAGLQLAALSIMGRSDTAAFIQAFTGSHVYVAEYLTEEILQRQPDDVQLFLLQTSILDRMNAGLCEAVTDCPDGQAILNDLHRANIFIVPLDDEGQWFRYHHLFADLLQAHLLQALPEDAIAALHMRASAWYEKNGFTVEAINHALAAKDYESVASLVESVARNMIFTGRVNVLRAWLEAIPDETFHAHPRLGFYLFWIDLLQVKADLSDQAIQEKEGLLRTLPSSPENDRLRGELMAVVCRTMVLTGRTSRGIRLAQDALGYLAEEDLASRARANSALAIGYGLEGLAEDAAMAYRDCLAQALTAGDYRLAAHTRMAMGLIECHYGQLRAAAHTFQSIIDMGIQAGAPPAKKMGPRQEFFPAGQGYIGLANVHLERNDLQTAEGFLKQGMELCRRGGLDGIFLGRVFLSRLRQAQGDLDQALEEIRLAKQAFQRADDFNIAARQIEIRLAQGDIDGAVRWAAPLMAMLDDSVQLPLLFAEIVEALLIRVFLAQGEIGKVLQWLDRLQDTAEQGGRDRRLIEVHLLRALAEQKRQSGTIFHEAIGHLVRALELAEPEGFVLLFLEEGPALIPLLNAVVGHWAASDRVKKYARRLLSAFAEMGKPAAPHPPVEADGLVELLTPREMEVLQLVAAGDSNQAIADTLFITVRTVKKHISNILGKLEVDNRTQAALRARELGLVSD